MADFNQGLFVRVFANAQTSTKICHAIHSCLKIIKYINMKLDHLVPCSRIIIVISARTCSKLALLNELFLLIFAYLDPTKASRLIFEVAVDKFFLVQTVRLLFMLIIVVAFGNCTILITKVIESSVHC